MLQAYAENGCPVYCGPDWSRHQIQLALQQGPHKSARSKDAITALHTETEGKVANGFAKIIKYGDIKSNLPRKLKISPV
eukprot:11813091-Ditylum_brightwellii.AAC.1